MSENTSPNQFGRVDADGTVYVCTSQGERAVGSVPDATPEAALAFFTKRFDALEGKVNLLEQRIKGGKVRPEDGRKSISALRQEVAAANAVGDLEGLDSRLENLLPVLDEIAATKKAARETEIAQTKAAKEAMVAEAESLAASDDWRGGVDRFRALLEEWKALPRIDRTTDDELWHRFSSARTSYTRRRKAQFAAQNEKREAARVAKEAILKESRVLAESTDWGATASAFRDLMQRWRAAGAAPREVDDKMWTEFRELQDKFFAARNASFEAMESEYKENLAAKEALLKEAESTILPVEDLEKAKAAYRDFLERFNEIGRVPRDQSRAIEQRVRKIEQAVRGAEQAEWKRTDPEARKRAEETVSMFKSHIAKLEAQKSAAEAAGDERKVKDAVQSISTYQTWLEQAEATLADFMR